LGFATTIDASIATNSAYPPPAISGRNANTASPLANLPALAPALATTPATSHPRISGGASAPRRRIPGADLGIDGFTPAAITRTSTSVSFGTGRGTSS
jgi:hypothetical protein